MHNRLIRLILKVAIPTTLKVWRRPLFHLLEFLFRRTNLDTRFNSISSERTRTFEVPFVEDSFLDLGNTADEVVETLGVRLGTEDRECQVMILEVQTDTREVDYRLDASLLQLLGVTDTTALEDQWR